MKLLNEILGTKYPIIQGGMANIATGEFAAACSNAGALGLIGAGGMNADTLRQNIRRCKELTDKPFGVNIMLMHPQADEFAKIVVEEGVQVVTTGAGNPGKYVPMWKAAGIKVIPVVAAAVLAKHLEPLGIDAVIAEGTESGGHVGEMTTMALVPQVVDAVNVPVIAAGGIADGRQLAAALALEGSPEAVSGALALALGIGLQNIPEGAAVSLPLLRSGQSRGRAFLAGAASGLVEPLGGLLALAVAGWVSAALPWLMSAAAGCMVCVTAQEMIPQAVEPDESAGVISIVLGFALMMALDVAL